MLLALMALAPSAQAVPVVPVVPVPECETVITGDLITLEGPEVPIKPEYVEELVYYYLWTAVDEEGSTIASGTDRIFEFNAPEVTPEVGSMYVFVSLLVTDGYGCIDRNEICFIVIALPTCGISGPESVCEDSPVTEYVYVGEATDTAQFGFLWSVDGVEVGDTETIEIDWNELSVEFGDHVLTLVVDKTYPAGTATSTCEMMVKYIKSPVATIGVSIGNGGE
ncbi:MAG: hypothetical protein ACXQT2_07290 [Methanotrichaceae archaeon]